VFISGFIIMPLFWDKLVGPANARGVEYIEQGGSSWLASSWGVFTAFAVGKLLQLTISTVWNKWM